MIAGANGSGKSVVADALRFLYGQDDRFGQPFTLANTRSARGWANAAETGEAESKEEASDWLAGEEDWRDEDGRVDPVWVIGEFQDLPDIWTSVAADGVLRVGSILLHGETYFCLVLPQGTKRMSAAFEAASAAVDAADRSESSVADWTRLAMAMSDTSGQMEAIRRAARYETKDETWIEWDDVARLVESSVLSIGDGWDEVPYPEALVHLPGPEVPFAGVRDLLLPLVRKRLPNAVLRDASSRGLSSEASAIRSWETIQTAFADAVLETVRRAEASFEAALPRYVSGLRTPRLRARLRQPGWLEFLKRSLVDIDIRVSDGGPAREMSPQQLGAGTARAMAFAVLEMYRDQDIWDAKDDVLIVIEEPEVGLHPAAQRRVVAALSGLATYGVQTIVMTHSPLFLRSAPTSALRITQVGPPDEGNRVVDASDLRDAAEALGCSPADAIMVSRFVVVEGTSDALILATWAEAAGVDLDAAGVRLVPARGYGESRIVSRVLALAYEGINVIVVLDNGRDTAAKKLELESEFGDAVTVELLAKTEIEAYFPLAAIKRWLDAQGVEADPDALDEQLHSGIGAKKALGRVAVRYLQRAYRVPEDGHAIAATMTEAEIAPELRALFARIGG